MSIEGKDWFTEPDATARKVSYGAKWEQIMGYDAKCRDSLHRHQKPSQIQQLAQQLRSGWRAG